MSLPVAVPPGPPPSHAPPPADPAAAPTPGGVGAPASPEVPRDTTPTFELEMLVSGAVLYGLFQLTDALEAWVAFWRPNVGLLGTFVVVGGGLLVRTAFYGLIVCFVAHLAIRAYWVALVGANSVFPGGPRWDRMKQYGPIQAELSRARVRPLPEFIRRADNAASIVFATGLVFSMSLVASIALLVPFGVLVWALQRVVRLEMAMAIAGVGLGALAIAQLAAVLIDYRRRERLDPASSLGRAVRSVLRMSLAASPPAVRSLGAVVSTNLSPMVVAAWLIGSAVVVSGASMWRSVREGGLPGGSDFRFFADEGPATLRASGYASLDAGGDDRAPWIDTDVVTGPYVRLHIPYRPLVHDQALAAACPELRPLDFDDQQTPEARAAGEAVLRCAARVHRIAVDGRPLDSLRLRFFGDLVANRRVFLAHVPVRGLSEGEHVLTVWPVTRPGRPAATAPFAIPFWR